MAEKLKRKLLFITVLLIVLLTSSAYAARIPNVHAAEPTLQEKGLTVLNNAVGLDLAKYATVPKDFAPDFYFAVLPQEKVG